MGGVALPVGAHPGTIEDSGVSVCTSAAGLGVLLCGLSVDVKLSNCFEIREPRFGAVVFSPVFGI